MAVLTRELGVDLGTSNTVFAEGNQVLLQEPTMVAILIEEEKMVEWGQAAKDMVGRVPDSIEVISPIHHGVIAEYEITETLLGYLTRKVVGPMRVFRPRMMIAVPYGVTSVEGRAVHEAGIGAGSREVFLVAQQIAAALGVICLFLHLRQHGHFVGRRGIPVRSSSQWHRCWRNFQSWRAHS